MLNIEAREKKTHAEDLQRASVRDNGIKVDDLKGPTKRRSRPTCIKALKLKCKCFVHICQFYFLMS